jgi:hypothetical protein
VLKGASRVQIPPSPLPLHRCRRTRDCVSGAAVRASLRAKRAARVSGEGGIRTLDGDIRPHNALAGRRLQPLGHFSGLRNRVSNSISIVCAESPFIGSARSAALPKIGLPDFPPSPAASLSPLRPPSAGLPLSWDGIRLSRRSASRPCRPRDGRARCSRACSCRLRASLSASPTGRRRSAPSSRWH